MRVQLCSCTGLNLAVEPGSGPIPCDLATIRHSAAISRLTAVRPSRTLPLILRQAERTETQNYQPHGQSFFRIQSRTLRLEIIRTIRNCSCDQLRPGGQARPDLAAKPYSGCALPGLATRHCAGRIRRPCGQIGSGANHIRDLAISRDSGWHRKTVVSRCPNHLAATRTEMSCDNPPGFHLTLRREGQIGKELLHFRSQYTPTLAA